MYRYINKHNHSMRERPSCSASLLVTATEKHKPKATKLKGIASNE